MRYKVMVLQTSVLIVGMRKAGTSWLYSNLQIDPDVNVSNLTKESRFFTGDSGLTKAKYEKLFSDVAGVVCEVDASVCYSDVNVDRILAYNAEMKVILILREPAAYLASRFIHSKRKGEISEESVSNAILNNKWLQRELDYGRIVNQYKKFQADGLFLLKFYDELETDPIKFYDSIKKFALGSKKGTSFVPQLSRVNVARASDVGKLSSYLSQVAWYARKIGLHRIVNIAKSIGLHTKLERPIEGDDKALIINDAALALANNFPSIIADYEELRKIND